MSAKFAKVVNKTLSFVPEMYSMSSSNVFHFMCKSCVLEVKLKEHFAKMSVLVLFISFCDRER